MARTTDATVHLIRGLKEGRNAVAGAVPNRFPAEPSARRNECSASLRVFPEVRSAISSGASSVGPYGTRWRRRPPYFLLKTWLRRGARPKTSQSALVGVPVSGDAAMGGPWVKRAWGPAAARAQNRPSICPPRAALAGKGSEIRRNLLWERKGSNACTGRLNATQPGVLAVSTLYIRGLAGPCKGARRHGNTIAYSRKTH